MAATERALCRTAASLWFGNVAIAQQGKAKEAAARQYAGEMVSIPGGTFRMGNLSGEGDDEEKPVHSVRVPAFKSGKHEGTFAQWDACVTDGECRDYKPDDEGWGRGNLPVINVSWQDITSFIDWLNRKTGCRVRRNGNMRPVPAAPRSTVGAILARRFAPGCDFSGAPLNHQALACIVPLASGTLSNRR